MSDSVTIEDSKGETFAEVIDVIGVSEVKKAFQQSVKEGSLHKWFKGSKSKDGKPGWVNVVTGGTCASDKPGEGTPKCVSSSKRASMTKAERLSAARRKKKADPGQQQKTGAAKPTYVSTDKPKKKMKEELEQVNEVMGVVKQAVKLPGNITKLPGKMAASVLPEPLKTGVKLPGKIASLPTDTVANLIPGGKKKMKEEVKRDEYGDPIGGPKISKKQVKKNLASNAKDEKIVHSEGAAWTKKAGKNKEGGLNEKGRKSYERENPGSDLKAPSKKKGNKRRKSFCARMKGMKKKLTSAKTARDPDSRINKSLRAWNCSYEPQGKLVEDYEERAKSRQKFVDFYKKAKEAKAKKQADSTRSDSRRHGIKFSDAKGSGRLKAGKKIYD